MVVSLGNSDPGKTELARPTRGTVNYRPTVTSKRLFYNRNRKYVKKISVEVTDTFFAGPKLWYDTREDWPSVRP
jgi:hypothetical protein